MEKLKEKVCKAKKEGGITLIALVVTIIVLLILAGISIQMLTGENGILKRATEAREKTEEATEQEQRDLAKLEAEMNLETYNYETDEKDKSGELITVPIPAGFAPTGKKGENKIEDGFVITDSEGNEFVWIPCFKNGESEETRQNAVKYEKDSDQPNNNLASTWKNNYSSKQWWYTKIASGDNANKI